MKTKRKIKNKEIECYCQKLAFRICLPPQTLPKRRFQYEGVAELTYSMEQSPS
jgi:hypothetical protein